MKRRKATAEEDGLEMKLKLQGRKEERSYHGRDFDARREREEDGHFIRFDPRKVVTDGRREES